MAGWSLSNATQPVKSVYGKSSSVALGNGSTRLGASAKICRFSGMDVGLGGKFTSGMMRAATATRVARVAVEVGEDIIVAVANGEGVKVTVGDSVAVKVAVAEGSVSGWRWFCVSSAFPPNSR